MLQNTAVPKMSTPDTVDGLIEEIAVRLYRTSAHALGIKTALVGPFPVAEIDGSVPAGIVDKLEKICRFISDINDTLSDAANTLNGNYCD